MLDGAEVRMLIAGGTLPAMETPKPPRGAEPEKPAVRPEGGHPIPGLLGGERPQPA